MYMFIRYNVLYVIHDNLYYIICHIIISCVSNVPTLLIISQNVIFVFSLQVIDAFKADVVGSMTALDQALVGRREVRYVTDAQRARNAQLKTLCQDIRDGRKDVVRFLTGVVHILRPTKPTNDSDVDDWFWK